MGPLVAFITCEFIFCLLGPTQISDALPARDTSLLRGLLSTIALLSLVAIGLFSASLPNIYVTFRAACLPLAIALVLAPLTGEVGLALVRAILSALVSLIVAVALHHILRRPGLNPSAAICGISTLYLASEAASCLALVIGTFISTLPHPLAAYGAIGLSIVVLMAALCALMREAQHRFEAIAGEEAAAIERALARQRLIDVAKEPEQRADSAEEIRQETRVRRLARRYSLSRREAQVVGRYAQGRSAESVARDLGLKTSTVRSYLKHVFGKLDIHSKQELIELYDQLR